jgi:hypothetical protein
VVEVNQEEGNLSEIELVESKLSHIVIKMEKVVKPVAEKFIMYEQLLLDEIKADTSTELYSLEPIGRGTSEVESLTSYMMRLSEQHSITVGRLLSDVFAPYLQHKSYVDLFRQGQYTAAFYINSSNHLAKDFVYTTEKLTGVIDLSDLTLINWSGIRKRELVKERRTWCSICLYEMKENGMLYEPLIWCVKLINICAKHKVLLEDICPSCKSQLPPIQTNSRVGYCQKCNTFLGMRNQQNKSCDEEHLEWETWKCTVIADMITSTATNEVLTTNQITQCIQNMVCHISKGNKSEFSRKFGLNRDMTRNWCKGTHIPKLERVIQFSFYYGVPLLELLGNFPWQHQHFNRAAYRYIKKKKLAVVNRQEIRLFLQGIIERNDDPPPSLAQLLKETNYSFSVLYYNAGEECRQITRTYRTYLSNSKNKRREGLFKEIEKAVLSIIEEQKELVDGSIKRKLNYKIHYKEYIELRDKVFLKLNIDKPKSSLGIQGLK